MTAGDAGGGPLDETRPMMFSIIIPTYNRFDLLKRTLDTVWSQTFTGFEVIVVDDGSTDGTREFLRDYGQRLRLFHEVNRGPGAARNLGAAHATGRYLAFLDSDDLWFPWTLATIAGLIREHHEPSVLSGRLVPFHDEAELTSVRDGPVTADVFPDYLASSREGYFVGACIAVLRRDEFTKSGGFTERRINSEDHDLILRMGTAPGFVQVLGPGTLGYRMHTASATADETKSVAGAAYLLEQERRGAYPGGLARARERRRIVTLHTRPLSLRCLGRGRRHDSWWLYRQSFLWHLQLGRWKYLVGFPLRAFTS
jgi:cellulose synthase/poly-beta-1,6-N-acetylglucosamine synthase-like glycosyltransferase